MSEDASLDAPGAPDAESSPAESDEGEDLPETDGGERPQAHTVRLELVDEPGQLLAALRPIAENGGNLLSIFHERGNLTPRGHIPVEVDLECPPDRFELIVDALRENGINVIQAGAERYGEQLTLLLVGHLVDTDLSDTLQQIADSTDGSVTDLSLSAPEGTEDVSSARLRLATRSGHTEDVLATVREVAREKNLRVVEPLPEGSA
jgi:ACT domain-containing protein